MAAYNIWNAMYSYILVMNNSSEIEKTILLEIKLIRILLFYFLFSLIEWNVTINVWRKSENIHICGKILLSWQTCLLSKLWFHFWNWNDHKKLIWRHRYHDNLKYSLYFIYILDFETRKCSLWVIFLEYSKWTECCSSCLLGLDVIPS